ncbi:MAG: class beta-lactamase [Crocinitomicaceae bacterium]|nr:class beta-lactamase [Crocinitomicaceae bacterium]
MRLNSIKLTAKAKKDISHRISFSLWSGLLKKSGPGILCVLAFFHMSTAQEFETRESFGQYYEKYKLQGSFVVLDGKSGKYTVYNKEQVSHPFTPASTFKICNSLIGLETGVIRDENFVIKWDSVKRWSESWNKDHTLKEAFKNSTVWYYQELARRVGGERMAYWLNKADYGNKDTSGGIDMFWLNASLRITPLEQIDFLQKLYKQELPFSRRNMEIVKQIMFIDEKDGVKLYGKTGWGFQDKLDIGWFIGFVETKDKVYFFANCVQTADEKHPDFLNARRQMALEMLDELGIRKL